MDWDDEFTVGSENVSTRRKYLVVVIYDISDNTRRYKMGKMLSGYGYRVQRSAFECYLTAKQYEHVVAKAKALINEKEDLLRIYKIAGKPEIVYFGNIGLIDDDEVLINIMGM